MEEVIISGASGNIGSELSKVFIKNGYQPRLLYYSNEKPLEELNAFKYKGDLSDAEFVADVLKDVDFSKRLININCAGYTVDKLCFKLTEQEFMRVLDVNLKGVFLLCREVLRKQKNGAHIINLSSISGVAGREGQSAYSAAKGALISFTKSFAREGGKFDVCANVVLPGFIPSKIGQSLSDKALNKIKDAHLLGRLQTKQESALFLYNLSKMQNISAQVFNLDSRIMS